MHNTPIHSVISTKPINIQIHVLMSYTLNIIMYNTRDYNRNHFYIGTCNRLIHISV